MNTLFEPLGLRSPDGRQAQLLSVQLHAEVLGLMLRLTLRQTWRNTSGAPMATRWTFPLGAEQCLLDLQVQRPGGVQTLTRSTRLDRQVCSAGFGVMATGEQVTLQVRIAQLMQLHGGSLRLALPAALVPAALRPARVGIELHEPLTCGTAACTSHELQRVRHANGMTLQLQAPHGLERELALTVHGLRETSFALASPDPQQPEQCTVLASHSLQLPASTGAAPLRLKLVFDHSAAIGQERLGQLRAALERLIAELRGQDQLSYSVIGVQLAHELPRLQPCTEAYVRRARSLLRHTPAEAAQTDWAQALAAVAALRDEDETPVEDADLLLVTGQSLAPSPALTLALRRSGHRLHVLAVGEAVHSAWPELARASGGHCEGMAPGQHSQHALQRLLSRMRSLRPVQARLSVHGQPLTPALPAPTRMADGDTLHLWGQRPAAPAQDSRSQEADLIGQPQWQAQLQWQVQDQSDAPALSSAAPVLWDAEGDLARLCRAVQDQFEPVLEEAAPDVVAASSGLASAAAPRVEPHVAAQVASPDASPYTSQNVPQVASPAAASVTSARHADTPATVLPMRPSLPAHPLSVLVQQFNQQAPAYQQFRAALSATLQRCGTRSVDGLVMHLARQAGNPGRVWAQLLHHLHADQQLTLVDAALALVERELASLPLSLRQSLHAQLVAAAPGQRGAGTTRQVA